MKSDEIREKFLSFFKSKGHTIVRSSSLVPNNDQTLMFTNSGMVQFKDIFLGLYTPTYSRAVTSQRSVRTGGKHNDLEKVGCTARHHTFFEMLGNFSFGDYFKREAINFAWELLTEVYRLPKEKLLVTTYQEDDETYDIWVDEIGIPVERIIRIYDNKGSRYASDNFWTMADTGPCGPCTEIFYDHGPDVSGGPPGSLEENGDRYIEIWNLVFIEFNCDVNGNMTYLPKRGVDTGMGLERLAAVLQGVHSNYEIDLFQNLIKAAARETGIVDTSNNSLKVIADHIRACSFLIFDGVIPSNEGRGYVLRRIIRRAIRHGYMLGHKSAFFHRLVPDLIVEMGDAYPELNESKLRIINVLRYEEESFLETIERGMSILDNALTELNTTTNKVNNKILDSELVFKLHDTYGFPLDITTEVCSKHGVTVDQVAFNNAMAHQRKQVSESKKSRIVTSGLEYIGLKTIFHGYDCTVFDNAKVVALYINGSCVNEVKTMESPFIVIINHTPFYAESGGQIGDQGILMNEVTRFSVDNTFKVSSDVIGHHGLLENGTIKVGDVLCAKINAERRMHIQRNHSAIHLMHKALRDVFGEHISQKGSFVDKNRARFDFSHNKPLTDAEILKIELIVNAEILKNSPRIVRIMSYEEAVKNGAIALFGEKYGDKVRVLSIGFSIELCGGTHVQRTGDIGLFKIVSESNISSGIRRIEAITGDNAIRYIQDLDTLIKKVAISMKTTPIELVPRIGQIQDRVKFLEKELLTMKSKFTSNQGEELARKAIKIGDAHVLTAVLEDADLKTLRKIVDKLKEELKKSAIVLATIKDCKIILIAGVSLDVSKNVKANDLVNFVAHQIGGSGGGRPDMAQGGGTRLENLQSALDSVRNWIVDRI